MEFNQTKDRIRFAILCILCLGGLSSLGIEIYCGWIDGHLPYRISWQESRTVTIHAYWFKAALAASAVCFAGCYLVVRAPKLVGFRRVSISCFILCIASPLLFDFFFPVSGVHSTISPLNACLNNLSAIDRAKEQWAMDRRATNGELVSWANVDGAIGHAHPGCPTGGEYKLGRVGERVICPRHGSIEHPVVNTSDPFY
jgi:hypothetical protein